MTEIKMTPPPEGGSAEDGAPELDDFLENWLGNAHCPLLVHDAEETILFANVSAGMLFGYPAPRLRGMKLQDITETDAGERQSLPDGVIRSRAVVARKTRLPLETLVQPVLWQGMQYFVYTAQSQSEKQFLLEKNNQYARDLSLFQLFLLGSESDFPDEKAFFAYIAQALKDFAGAFFVSISEYEPTGRMLSHRHIAIDSRMVGKLYHLLGAPLEKIQTPLTRETEQHVIRSGWTIEKSLYECAFGSIPKPVADTVQRWLQIDRFIGISFLHGDELLGTSLLALQAHQPDPSIEMLQVFRHAVSQMLFIHRLQKEVNQVRQSVEISAAMEMKGRIACSMAPRLMEMLEQIMADCRTPPGTSEAANALARILPVAQELAGLLRQFSEFEP